MMEYAKARNLCRVLVVNKIDHAERRSCGALLDDLRDTFGPEVLPLNLPADGGKRVVDCFWQRQPATATSARSPTGTRRSSTRWSRSTRR